MLVEQLLLRAALIRHSEPSNAFRSHRPLTRGEIDAIMAERITRRARRKEREVL